MAIDTAAKRASAVRFLSPWATVLPVPSGSIGQGARQATAFMYSGILAGTPVDEFVYGNNDVWLVDRRPRVALVAR
jgi:hypothetical protein